MTTLSGRRILMSGGSRGIGLAIALRAARDGANIALLAKTATEHERLEGTVYSAAREIERMGGRALPIVGDVRFEDDINRAVAQTVKMFGGIDVCINNASALDLRALRDLPATKFDLLQAVNVRATFLLSRACVPHLANGEGSHILTLSPPMDLSARWLGPHLGYTLSKYGMSLCTLGMANELRPVGVAVNSLWPRTLIDTAAVRNLMGGAARASRARKPAIMADAAHAILTSNDPELTGRLLIDEEFLRDSGVEDFNQYAVVPGQTEAELDLFVNP